MRIGDHLKTWDVPTPALTGREFTLKLEMTADAFREDLSGRVISYKDDKTDINLIESRNKVLVCLSCPLDNRKKDFRATSGLTMANHLMEHQKFNHQVPSSVIVQMLLRGADGR